MTQSNRERQAAFRARNAAKGRAEFRGLFVTGEEAQIIKLKIVELLKKLRK